MKLNKQEKAMHTPPRHLELLIVFTVSSLLVTAQPAAELSDQNYGFSPARQANAADVYKLLGTYFNAECGTNSCQCLIAHDHAGGYDQRRRGIRDCAAMGGSCVPVWVMQVTQLLQEINRKVDYLTQKIIVEEEPEQQ